MWILFNSLLHFSCLFPCTESRLGLLCDRGPLPGYPRPAGRHRGGATWESRNEQRNLRKMGNSGADHLLLPMAGDAPDEYDA